jgi:hypothetical protein
LQEVIFSRLPLRQLTAFREQMLGEGVRLLTEVFAG